MSTIAQYYIGTYTTTDSRGIYICSPDQGKLAVTGALPAVNPSWISIHEGRLYAVREEQPGGIVSWPLSGHPAAADRQWPCGGDDPCHLSFLGNHAYIANYTSGSLGILDLQKDGAPRVIQHRGGSVNPSRQEGPHVHQSSVTPDGSRLAVTDLGNDTVSFYPLSENGDPGEPETVSLPSGNGPRHLVFGREQRWYLMCELTGAIFVFEGYGKQAALRQRIDTLAEGEEGDGAAIRISENRRFLYASIRGTDRIAVFRISEAGLLTPADQVSSVGKCPRDFILTRDGLLLCTCEESDEVTVFALDDGMPRFLYSVPVPVPTCICEAPAETDR